MGWCYTGWCRGLPANPAQIRVFSSLNVRKIPGFASSFQYSPNFARIFFAPLAICLQTIVSIFVLLRGRDLGVAAWTLPFSLPNRVIDLPTSSACLFSILPQYTLILSQTLERDAFYFPEFLPIFPGFCGGGVNF
jgi:hypothetical protein